MHSGKWMNMYLLFRLRKWTALQITSFQYFIPSTDCSVLYCTVLYRVQSTHTYKWLHGRAYVFNGMISGKFFVDLNFYNRKSGKNTKNRLACSHNGDDDCFRYCQPTKPRTTKYLFEQCTLYRARPNLFVSSVHWTRFPINYSPAIAKCNICHIFDSYHFSCWYFIHRVQYWFLHRIPTINHSIFLSNLNGMNDKYTLEWSNTYIVLLLWFYRCIYYYYCLLVFCSLYILSFGCCWMKNGKNI